MRSAADLIREYLQCLEKRDVDGAFSLLRADAVSEWPYLPEGLQTIYPSAEAAHPFVNQVIRGLLAEVSIVDLEINEVSPYLAFAEFRSDCRTKKGLPYRNRYIVKAVSDGELITLWREYCDPLATKTVQ